VDIQLNKGNEKVSRSYQVPEMMFFFNVTAPEHENSKDESDNAELLGNERW